MGIIQKCFICVLLYKLQEKFHNYESKIVLEPLKMYWNVPSFQCKPFKLNFTTLLDQYAIVHNENGEFRGNVINILYDPGNFPAILKKGNEIFFRNGGVPQNGNLTNHLEIFQEILDQVIPDQNYSGIAIIDFESWRPIHRQNWGVLIQYKTLSEDIERQLHPLWRDDWIKKEAARRFEDSAKIFIEKTLNFAKELRPFAIWGYYHYPYCFNNGLMERCDKQVIEENNQLKWLFALSDTLYPSVYLQESYTSDQRTKYLESSLDEAFRIKNQLNNELKIFIYFWYKFQDTGNYIGKEVLFPTLVLLASYRIDGIILWGASADVNSKSHCLELYNYLRSTLGPVVLTV
ncbi:hypothetical protein ABEB36_007808 [Hypothenemus hampei]|uniref:Hyaluronidase n=1 Tax=Hypothenemus hampei TaxID=57062 RepID=A0ABD1EVQ5_HYPHA